MHVHELKNPGEQVSGLTCIILFMEDLKQFQCKLFLHIFQPSINVCSLMFLFSDVSFPVAVPMNDDGMVYKLQLVSHLIIYYCVQPIVTAGFTVVIS